MSEAFRTAWDRLFNSGDSLSRIRDAALADRLFSTPDGITLEISGRSLAWKLFLISDEPLQKSSTLALNSHTLLTSLRTSRKRYAESLTEKMRAPDGSYPEGFIPPDSVTPKKDAERVTNLEKNNPLSLHSDNPWKEWFAAVELRKTILQDVERTLKPLRRFPEIDFFRRRDVQEQLTNILYLYSSTHPAIGYRQGMHELLAPVYLAVDFDSTAIPSGFANADAHEICSATWVAADAWNIFQSIMNAVSIWYEWREGLDAANNLPSPLSHHVNLNVAQGSMEIKPYVAPIVQACNKIQSSLLRSVDPLLWKHIQSTGIEPQIYGIRWLRLLFTREFSLPDAMKLWDGLFACDPSFELAQWICVAMLIRIRNQLLSADYTGQLTVLLRYPTPASDDPGSIHHTNLLLRQALALQMSPTPATGSSLVLENRNILNIPVDIPEPAPVPRRRAPPAQTPRSPDGHSRQPSSPQMGIPELIARGLVERGESLGINKTLMSAVSELRRNIPELAASFVRTPNQQHSVFPLMDERSPEERPPWEPRSRSQMEREIEGLRANNKRLGESLTWVVDTLLQDQSEASDPQALQHRKQGALETLSYIRDVLNGGIHDLDEDRLFDDSEKAKRKSHLLVDTKAKSPTTQGYFDGHIPSPKAPSPVSVAETSSKTGKTRSSISHPTVQSPQYQLPASPPTSLTPSLTPLTPSNGIRMAPWNYTKSSFSGDGSPLPSASLPRPPPRSSSSLHRPSVASVFEGKKKEEKPRQPSQDPLGVLS
ncbi:hypothetical protein VNI00_008221 [Paramarasmius palmivorus]|uniref:Rab-GAP TBC domain-containing protein n=1 Tax=Paramarasmius palmivorus TaxID=297713 RepID=A0AAW0CXD2_9AGAR